MRVREYIRMGVARSPFLIILLRDTEGDENCDAKKLLRIRKVFTAYLQLKLCVCTAKSMCRCKCILTFVLALSCFVVAVCVGWMRVV